MCVSCLLQSRAREEAVRFQVQENRFLTVAARFIANPLMHMLGRDSHLVPPPEQPLDHRTEAGATPWQRAKWDWGTSVDSTHCPGWPISLEVGEPNPAPIPLLHG